MFPEGGPGKKEMPGKGNSFTLNFVIDALEKRDDIRIRMEQRDPLGRSLWEGGFFRSLSYEICK